MTEGLDVVDTINQAPVGPNPRSGEPSAPEVTLGIQSVTIQEDGQPMDALDGGLSGTTAGAPVAGATDAAAEGASAAALVQPTGADGGDGNIVWIASGVGVGAVAVLGYGVYRRSRTVASAAPG